MFEGQKYLTRGIQEEIGIDIQILMWKLINNIRKREGFKLDYLQTFDLEVIEIDGLNFQRITHKQEVEPYFDTNVFRVKKPVSEKIFVISSINEELKEYSIMMLSEEY